jgi:hypothetical protein
VVLARISLRKTGLSKRAVVNCRIGSGHSGVTVVPVVSKMHSGYAASDDGERQDPPDHPP